MDNYKQAKQVCVCVCVSPWVQLLGHTLGLVPFFPLDESIDGFLNEVQVQIQLCCLLSRRDRERERERERENEEGGGLMIYLLSENV